MCVTLLKQFWEFWVQHNASYASVSNTLCAIRTKFSMLGVQTAILDAKRISYYVKSLHLHRPLCPRLKPIIDPPLLEKNSQICDSMYQGHIFKTLCHSIFSFRRISNFVPHSIAKCTPSKQLARADVIFAPPGALLLIKWCKIMQSKDKMRNIEIPELPN